MRTFLTIAILFLFSLPAEARIQDDESMPIEASGTGVGWFKPSPAAYQETRTSRRHTKKKKRRGRAASRKAKYAPLVARYARKHGVPVKLALIITKIESNFNPRARSRARRGGARGLMQLWPPTARALGYRGRISGLYHPETNVKWAMKELAKCYRLARRNWRRTGHCYNGGPKRTYARRLPRETRNYGHMIVRMRRA